MSPLQGSVKAPCPAPFHPSSHQCLEPAGRSWGATELCPLLFSVHPSDTSARQGRYSSGTGMRQETMWVSAPHAPQFHQILLCSPWALLGTPGLCFPAFYLNHRSGHGSHAPKLWFTAHKRDGEHWTCKEEICYLLHLPKQLPAECPWLLGVPSYLCTPDKSCAFYAASRSWMSVWSC